MGILKEVGKVVWTVAKAVGVLALIGLGSVLLGNDDDGENEGGSGGAEGEE